MNRITATIAATVAAFLLATPMAWADEAPVITDPVTGEVVANVDCYNEPYEWADGWVCTSMDEAERQGLLTCEAETVEYEPGVWTCEVPTPEVEPSEEPAPVVAEPKPVAVPVVIVEGDGDWDWSDAREMYGA
jgi:hypothetical protein